MSLPRRGPIKPTEQNVTKWLRHYLLVTDESPMLPILERIVNAALRLEKLRYCYGDAPTMCIEGCLNDLDLKAGEDYECVKLDSPDQRALPPGVVRVPSYAERAVDLELILPFYFAQLQKTNPDLVDWSSLRIEVPAVLLIAHLLSESRMETEQLLLQFVRNARDGVISAELKGDFPDAEHFSETFYSMLRALRSDAAAYAGISEDFLRLPGTHNEVIIAGDGSLRNAWINQLSRKMSGKEDDWNRYANVKKYGIVHNGVIYDPDDPGSRGKYPEDAQRVEIKPKGYPRLKISLARELKHVGIMARNLYRLRNASDLQRRYEEFLPETVSIFAEEEKSPDEWNEIKEFNAGYYAWKTNNRRVLSVLLGRLKEKDEGSLRADLGFKVNDKYLWWQDENNIGLVDLRRDLSPAKVYENWTKAQEQMKAVMA